MANYSTSAEVVLTMNGKQAEKVLDKLQKDAQRLEKEITAAAQAGDKVAMKKLQRELNQTNKLINQMQGAAKSAEQVLARLDKASPKELKKTLRQLQKELNGIERGSTAWDAHIAKIRAVKEEIAKINDLSVGEDESWWEKLQGWFSDKKGALLGAAASFAAVAAGARQAVEAYAALEAEEANVRKFTGMTAEQVEALNEEFKKMDTSTSIEELNKLAQEAGRLGKTSSEDILGFVKAADVINVALDDLGEGATLQLSKLTQIFGDEKRLGTEQSLLSVGSVINELSQNCAAAAPYLVDFASRLGGVGAQAGMTVQQIMAYAAVFDAQGQKVEAAATALSQVIVRMYQDPAKYAKAAGLNVKEFAELVRKDANEALLTLSQALNEKGGLKETAPIFAEMKENGARAVAALATLANNVQEVRNQQEVANEAFAEGNSVLKEYEVQNNTVQASLDKTKNKFHILITDLGKALTPVMNFAVRSANLFIQVLSRMVKFISDNKGATLSLIVGITAYTVAVKAATIAAAAHSAIIKTLTVLNKAYHIGQLMVAAAYNKVAGNATRAAAATRSLNNAMKGNLVGLIIGLLATAAAAILDYTIKTKNAKEEMARLRKEEEEQKAALRDITEATAQYAGKEKRSLDALYKAATDEAKSKEERIKAAEKLKKMYPEYFGQLSTEAILVGNAKKKYDELSASIIANAKARAAADKIKENMSALLELEQQFDNSRNKDAELAANVAQARRLAEGESSATNGQAIPATARAIQQAHGADVERAVQAYDENQNERKKIAREMQRYKDANEYLIKTYKVSTGMITGTEDNTEVSISGGGSTSGNTKAGHAADKFQEEKDWQEVEQAKARIARATGQIITEEGERQIFTREDYNNRLLDIEREYCEKILARTDLTEKERINIMADAAENEEKIADSRRKHTIDEEMRFHETEVANIQQAYIDGQVDHKTYIAELEDEEIEHLRNMVELTQEGTEDRLKAEKEYRERLLADAEKRQTETTQKEEEYQNRLRKIKEEIFGNSQAENDKAYKEELSALQAVYDFEVEAAGDNAKEKLRIEDAFQKAKLALMVKYNQEGADANKNALEKMAGDIGEWLNGDGGKALTGTINTLVSGMASIFSQLTTMIEADVDMQTAKISKRYDAEITFAEGNSYRVAQLEKQKEEEIAKVKNEANRKMFAMQVIQAVAQTAQNAIAAYGSALEVPTVGIILAPIAAAMAVAAGALQIANIKKQQQAAEAQGYSEGGFTPDGDKYKPVGIVHAGEWVASQKLTKNAQVRPLLEALDQAQRNNTIGSIKAADVSRSITAPFLLASSPSTATMPNVIVNVPNNNNDGKLGKTLEKLNNRLENPIGAVVTVSGDKGIAKAQEEYDRLIRNKTPRHR